MGPKIGATLIGLTGFDPSGSPVNISFNTDGRKTVLLVFSTECRICGLNWPSWQMLANSLDQNSYRVVYINASIALTPEYSSKQYQATSDYLKQHQVGMSPVLAQVDPGALVRSNITLVPETILINAHGKIEKAWLGMIEGDQLSDLRRTLSI